MNPSPSAVLAPPTHPLAVVSLISGIASYVIAPFFGAVVAIICGHMARSQLRAEPGVRSGEGLALAGLILGYAHLALTCIGLGVFLVVFGGIAGMAAANR